jgi:hypothetical protein
MHPTTVAWMARKVSTYGSSLDVVEGWQGLLSFGTQSREVDVMLHILIG